MAHETNPYPASESGDSSAAARSATACGAVFLHFVKLIDLSWNDGESGIPFPQPARFFQNHSGCSEILRECSLNALIFQRYLLHPAITC
jgi:hypothetical protein